MTSGRVVVVSGGGSGIGEAIVTVLNPDGAPTPVAWTRMLAPMASMDPTKFVQAKTSIESAFGWRTTAAPVDYNIPVLPSPPKAEFTPIPRQAAVQYFKRIGLLILGHFT